MMLQAPIVGMHFRGGWAKALVQVLAIGTPLSIKREPDNAYSTYACKVILYPCDIFSENKQIVLDACEGGGLDLDSGEPLFLGYVMENKPKNFTGNYQPFAQLVTDKLKEYGLSSVPATFSRAMEGTPLAMIDLDRDFLEELSFEEEEDEVEEDEVEDEVQE